MFLRFSWKNVDKCEFADWYEIARNFVVQNVDVKSTSGGENNLSGSFHFRIQYLFKINISGPFWWKNLYFYIEMWWVECTSTSQQGQRLAHSAIWLLPSAIFIHCHSLRYSHCPYRLTYLMWTPSTLLEKQQSSMSHLVRLLSQAQQKCMS